MERLQTRRVVIGSLSPIRGGGGFDQEKQHSCSVVEYTEHMESEGSGSSVWLTYTPGYMTLKELLKTSVPHFLIRKKG